MNGYGYTIAILVPSRCRVKRSFTLIEMFCKVFVADTRFLYITMNRCLSAPQWGWRWWGLRRQAVSKFVYKHCLLVYVCVFMYFWVYTYNVQYLHIYIPGNKKLLEHWIRVKWIYMQPSDICFNGCAFCEFFRHCQTL